MRRIVAATLALLAVGVAAFWLRSGPSSDVARPAPRRATSLSESLAPLRAEFNDSAVRPRLLVVLSPTCPVCFYGAQALASELLPTSPELVVLLVWTEVLPWDAKGKIGKRVAGFDGSDAIHQFSDRRQLVARAVGELLVGEAEPLWDVFLYYPPGARWDDRLPPPTVWLHQQVELDPEHYRTGPALRAAFRELAARAELRAGG